MLSQNLEKTLREAYQLATNYKHEYVTLEHLLFSLLEDQDAISVLKACAVDISNLKESVEKFIINDLENLKENFTGEPKLTNGFQRVLQRAAIHVQSSGRESVTGANMIVALFSEKESHAVYFLHQQNMSRLDAVQYISHGISKANESFENEEFVDSQTNDNNFYAEDKKIILYLLEILVLGKQQLLKDWQKELQKKKYLKLWRTQLYIHWIWALYLQVQDTEVILKKD